ncbi:MAG: hypothetical protein ACE5G1_12790 [bacterium]
MKPSLVFVWIFILTASALFAQPGNLTLYLFGSASLPNSDFGKDIGNDAKITRRSGFDIGDKVGLANTGFGGGVELFSPVWFKGLHWVLSTRVFVNGTEEAAVRSKFRALLGDSVDVEFEFGQWINIPIMTGFRYDFQLMNNFKFYGILQAGVNWSKAASRKATLGDLTVEDTSFDFARDFGFEFGLGLVLRQRYNVGFRYLSLSSPRYAGTRKLSEKMFPEIFSRETAILGEERSISTFVVTVGVQLSK